jgi:adenylosuccinate synthase
VLNAEVCALVGGQYGSEGKGLIAGHIAKDYDDHVRVGAANAGHTVYTGYNLDRGSNITKMGIEKHVLQQIPCAAYANPSARLYIGPGALITPHIFLRELEELQAWRDARGLGPKYVHVDWRAHVITEDQVRRESKTDLAERIGSTSTIAREGIGVAAADRVLRTDNCVQVASSDLASHGSILVSDVPALLFAKDRILLEGTQGTSLSNTTGDFPYVTSRNPTASGLAADAGIPPWRVNRVICVMRSFPIRVAGNSGPFFPDSREINWEDIGVNPESERTTVTKKVRRVATFSMEQLEQAVILNGPTEIALTFADYASPYVAGSTSALDVDVAEETAELIDAIEKHSGVPVRYVGTGPFTVADRKLATAFNDPQGAPA